MQNWTFVKQTDSLKNILQTCNFLMTVKLLQYFQHFKKVKGRSVLKHQLFLAQAVTAPVFGFDRIIFTRRRLATHRVELVKPRTFFKSSDTGQYSIAQESLTHVF